MLEKAAIFDTTGPLAAATGCLAILDVRNNPPQNWQLLVQHALLDLIFVWRIKKDIVECGDGCQGRGCRYEGYQFIFLITYMPWDSLTLVSVEGRRCMSRVSVALVQCKYT